MVSGPERRHLTAGEYNEYKECKKRIRQLSQTHTYSDLKIDTPHSESQGIPGSAETTLQQELKRGCTISPSVNFRVQALRRHGRVIFGVLARALGR
jgi:hypothetical protein